MQVERKLKGKYGERHISSNVGLTIVEKKMLEVHLLFFFLATYMKKIKSSVYEKIRDEKNLKMKII